MTLTTATAFDYRGSWSVETPNLKRYRPARRFFCARIPGQIPLMAGGPISQDWGPDFRQVSNLPSPAGRRKPFWWRVQRYLKGFVMTHNLTFRNHTLTVVHHDGGIWFTSADLAKALGYARADMVWRIHDRNRDEFSPDMSSNVNLTFLGSNLPIPTRIFSLRGAHLVAMFARTPVAKEFRRWVLDILDRETRQKEQTSHAPTRKTQMTKREIEAHIAGGRLLISFLPGGAAHYRLLEKGEVIANRSTTPEQTTTSLHDLAQQIRNGLNAPSKTPPLPMARDHTHPTPGQTLSLARYEAGFLHLYIADLNARLQTCARLAKDIADLSDLILTN